MHDATPAPRDRRREKNLQRILDTAMAQVVSGGFEALSVNKLAALLDYTPGALYRYFPSKDALVAALVSEIVAEVADALAAAASPELAPRARVTACAETWFTFSQREPERFALVAMLLAAPRLVLTDDAIAQRAMAHMLAAITPLTTALREAADAGELGPGDPLERAVLAFAGLNGVLLLKKQAARAPGLLDLERLYGAMLDTLLAGWAPPATAPTPPRRQKRSS